MLFLLSLMRCLLRFRCFCLLTNFGFLWQRVQGYQDKTSLAILQSIAQPKSVQEQLTAVFAANQPHECPMCNGVYASKKSLRVHLKRHNGTLPYLCLFGCGQACAGEADRDAHHRTHTGEKPFRLAC